MKKRSLLLAPFALAALAACAPMPASQAPASGAAARTFDLQGHRGARGLAPENTMVAFERALRIGVNTLELDVGVAADQQLVVAHDPYLNPVFTRDLVGQWLEGERGPLLKNMSTKMIQSYDVGRIKAGTPYAETFKDQQPADRARIPRLVDVFQMVNAVAGRQVRFNIETKINPTRPDETVSPEAMVDLLIGAIHEHKVTDRVTIQSFDWRTLQLVQKREPTIPTVYLTIQTANNDNVKDERWTAGFKLADHGGSVPRMVKAAGGATWSPNQGALTEALVKEAQGLGLKVIPWTVNEPAAMERLIDWGVDGIITDYPNRLREVMQRKRMPLPRPIQ